MINFSHFLHVLVLAGAWSVWSVSAAFLPHSGAHACSAGACQVGMPAWSQPLKRATANENAAELRVGASLGCRWNGKKWQCVHCHKELVRPAHRERHFNSSQCSRDAKQKVLPGCKVCKSPAVTLHRAGFQCMPHASPGNPKVPHAFAAEGALAVLGSGQR